MNSNTNSSNTGSTSTTSSSSSSSELPNIQENNTQILNDIQSLQTIEQQLFSSLEENTGLTSDQQQKLVEKINDISKMRINLYKTLNSVNNFFQDALVNSKGTLTEQTNAIDIVEKELNSSKQRLKALEEEKNNKIRLVEINNYYGEKYVEHASLMKIIIIMLIPILILGILTNKGILPGNIYFILIIIISIIGGIYIWKVLMSIMTRDNMNYEQYNWYFNPESAPTSTTVDDTDPWASTSSSSTFGTCVGDACCSDGLVYDSSNNVCTTDTSSNSNSNSNLNSTNSNSNSNSTNSNSNSNFSSKETFINNIFTKDTYFQKPDVILGSENIKSNNSKSFINYKMF